MSAVIETTRSNEVRIDIDTAGSAVMGKSDPATDRDVLTKARSQAHLLLVRSWPHLPKLAKRLATRLALPKVTLGVCAVIHDPAGRVLLAHHTYRPQSWDLPGGFMRRHEQPTEALARELREELGVQILVGPLLASSMTGSHLTLYYQAMMKGKPEADGVELDDWRFVDIAEVPELVGKTPNWLAWANPPHPAPARRDGEQTTVGD